MTDLFCGAGGSTTGAHQIPGLRTVYAANHWKKAVDSHAANHPEVEHDVADISQVEPSRYVRTDILWASPECTNHSQAKRGRKKAAGHDPTAERSRATMWDVVRFAEVHAYSCVVLENVVDAYTWVMFPAWLMAMEALGYDHQIVWLNSMFAQAAGDGAPQSRDRMYIVLWRRGATAPDVAKWTSPAAWCANCDADTVATQSFKRTDRPAWGRYRAQYVYRCSNTGCGAQVEPYAVGAHTVVDWSLPSTRLKDRANPLTEKTVARITAGIQRHAPAGSLRDQLAAAGWHDDPLNHRLDFGLGTGLAGFVMRNNGSKGTGVEHCTSLLEPVRTMTTAGHQSLVTWDADARRISAANAWHRMFEPHEVAASMAFPSGYVLLGNKRERSRMAGNAVTPPAARDLLCAVVESLVLAA